MSGKDQERTLYALLLQRSLYGRIRLTIGGNTLKSSLRSMTQFLDGCWTNARHILIRMRLRYRLLLFAVVVLIPMIAFSVYSVTQSANHAKQQTLNSGLAMAKVVTANLIEKTENTESLLQGLAQSSAIRLQDVQGTRELFIDVFPTQNSLINLSAADQQGHIFATIVWRGSEPRSVSSDPNFIEAMSSGNTVVSGSLKSTATDQHAIRMLVPFRSSSGRPSGALIADISLNKLQRRMTSIGIEEGTLVVVTDHTGTVLLHPSYKYVYEEANFGDWPSVAAALNGQEGSVEHINPLNKQPWLWAYAPVNPMGWAVVVGFPTATAFPPVPEIVMRSLLLLAFMVFLALVVAVYFSQRLSEPLRDFTDRALSISEGDFNQDMNVQGSEEIMQLSKAFNIMSEKLSQHMQRLAAAKEEKLREAKRLQYLLARTISLQENERRRIASDLHDGTSQLILGSLYETEAAIEMISSHPEMAKKKLSSVEDLLEQTSAEMRRVIYDLRPPLLDDMGFAAALERYISRYEETTGIQVIFNYGYGEGKIGISQETDLALYRIAQEALNNIQKHSQSQEARVRLEVSGDHIIMVIRDEGIGFETRKYLKGSSERLGLKGMIERAESVGANLEITSEPGRGTVVVFELLRDQSDSTDYQERKSLEIHKSLNFR